MKNLFFLLFIAILLPSCAGKVQKALNTWVGGSKSELIFSWGAPTQVFKLDDGGEILVYENMWQEPMSGGYRNCKVQMFVQRNGIINKWNYQGCDAHDLWTRTKRTN